MSLNAWIENNRSDDESLHRLHPDERCVRVPAEFIPEAISRFGVETRFGLGHVLSDGTWLDPVTGSVFTVETEN